MLKIIIVLATTFVFAGLLIAHPYTSPAAEPDGAKVAGLAPAGAPAVGQTKDSFAPVAQRPAPSQSTAQQDARLAGPNGGTADTPAPARPQYEAPRVQAPTPAVPQENRLAELSLGLSDNQTLSFTLGRPQPTGRAPVLGSATAPQPAAAAPRTDGRHWSQQPADVAPLRIEPTPPAGIRVVYNRPMPTEERIHLEHKNRYRRQ
jgi:hypothetical protein